MTEQQHTTQNAAPSDASAEEMEAAMAANVADEISRLQAELSELKAKNGEMADQYLRAKAETENMRRRADEEVAKARKFGIESFAESLLPVCDSLTLHWPSRTLPPNNCAKALKPHCASCSRPWSATRWW